MVVSLGVVCNVFNEINALPGWLEMATSTFDDVAVMHAGPGNADSTDGTIELLEKWKIPFSRMAIDEGFGIVRTAAVRLSKCDFVMLLDADERFHQFAPELQCMGEATPGDLEGQILASYTTPPRDTGAGSWLAWENVDRLGEKLTVTMGAIYNQAAWLKEFLQWGSLDAVMSIRRHWHDFSWKRPTQNWHERPDLQARIVRNVDHIHWDPNTRMHESLMRAPNRYRPNQMHGPFFDHYHFHFKKLESSQRAHDIAIYNAIHECRKPPSEGEFREGKR